MDQQPEVVELDDRRHEVQAQTDAGRIPNLVGAIEASQHGFGLLLADTRPRIAHTHHRFLVATCQGDLDTASFWSELEGIVDQIGDGFEQEIAVAADLELVGNLYTQVDLLVLGDRFRAASPAVRRGRRRPSAGCSRSPRDAAKP
jgi:hypothetical protein